MHSSNWPARRRLDWHVHAHRAPTGTHRPSSSAGGRQGTNAGPPPSFPVVLRTGGCMQTAVPAVSPLALHCPVLHGPLRSCPWRVPAPPRHRAVAATRRRKDRDKQRKTPNTTWTRQAHRQRPALNCAAQAEQSGCIAKQEKKNFEREAKKESRKIDVHYMSHRQNIFNGI